MTASMREIDKEMIEIRILPENNIQVHTNHLQIHEVFLTASQLYAIFRKMQVEITDRDEGNPLK